MIETLKMHFLQLSMNVKHRKKLIELVTTPDANSLSRRTLWGSLSPVDIRRHSIAPLTVWAEGWGCALSIAVWILSKLDSSCLTLTSTRLFFPRVLSLTQFNSVGFLQSRISVKKVCYHEQAINISITFCGRGCPVTSAPSRTRVMESLYLCSSRSNARGEVEGLKTALCQLKKPFNGLELSQVSCWKDSEWATFPDEGWWN